MATWQPNSKEANNVSFNHSMSMTCDHWPCEHSVPIVLKASGALSEIERLEARVSQLESELLTERFF